MAIKFRLITLLLLLIILIPACDKDTSEKSSRIVIGISSDVQSFNPVYAYSGSEINIAELLYPSFFINEWDSDKGDLSLIPWVAEKWEWQDDSLSIIIYLNDEIFWTDGERLTVEDIIFTFDLYSDPVIQSRFYGSFEIFNSDENLHINLDKSFEIIDSLTLKINFAENSNPSLLDIDFPVIPQHIFGKIERENFATEEKGKDSVTAGPMTLNRWNKNQSISLKANKDFIFYDPDNVDEIIFKIVPDYNSLLTQLKNGEIDIMEDIRTDDADDLNLNHIGIKEVSGRDYDYIGWNNINPENPKQKNKFFGSAKVREALTYGVNRKEILDEYLGKYGTLALGPVSPVFKDALNEAIKPLEYNPEKAKKILASEGWADKDRDGILEKGNLDFSFTLFIASGNPRRVFASTVVKNNLKSIGIEVNVETLEPGVFVDGLLNRKYDAWMAGWAIPIPLELKSHWHSDLSQNPMNLPAYKNPEADRILEEIEVTKSPEIRNELYKKFQEVIFNDNPVTFLYWIENIVGYNKKITNLNITPLGMLDNCWQWKTN